MPQHLRRGLSARTAQPNTPESDLEQEVLHIVTCTDDQGQRWAKLVMAPEPGAAIDIVSDMSEAEFLQLVDGPSQT